VIRPGNRRGCGPPFVPGSPIPTYGESRSALRSRFRALDPVKLWGMEDDSAQTAAETDPTLKALTHGLAFAAVVAPLWLMLVNAVDHQFAFDLHYAFIPAARAVLHGTSPYSNVTSRAVKEGIAYLYPPLGAYLFAPFTWLPSLAADILATALVAATVPATLLLLGVRDWRCHAIAFMWMPILAGIESANVTLPMVLGLALVWRYRERTVVVALVTGSLVALKVFFWPLLVWLLATRRYRSAGLGALASVGFLLGPWAGIGFAGFRGYPHLLSYVARREGPDSYSVAALIHFVLPSWTAAIALETAVGVLVLLLVVAAARRGRERDAFALAILAILVLTPLLEIHYLAALVVVVALYRRRLSAAWVVPLLMWGAPEANNGSGLNRVHVSLIAAAVVALALKEWRPRVVLRALRVEAT
jgi:hypothetical protein